MVDLGQFSGEVVNGGGQRVNLVLRIVVATNRRPRLHPYGRSTRTSTKDRERRKGRHGHDGQGGEQVQEGALRR